MGLLIDTYKANKDKSSLFSQEIAIDYYDGATEAICKIKNSEVWVIASMVYFNPDDGKRIFTMVEITEESLPAIKALAELSLNEGNVGYSSLKQEIEMYYKGYTGKVFLLMGDWLSSVHYQVVEMTNKLLCYFGDIEAVLAQDKMAQDKWIQLFSS